MAHGGTEEAGHEKTMQTAFQQERSDCPCVHGPSFAGFETIPSHVNVMILLNDSAPLTNHMFQKQDILAVCLLSVYFLKLTHRDQEVRVLGAAAHREGCPNQVPYCPVSQLSAEGRLLAGGGRAFS